jgi:hypothetical protein
MAQRRSGEVDGDLHEEFASGAKRDPRRESLQLQVPGALAVLGELQKELDALKRRVSALEAASERKREPSPDVDGFASKPTRQLKMPSRRPGPMPKK